MNRRATALLIAGVLLSGCLPRQAGTPARAGSPPPRPAVRPRPAVAASALRIDPDADPPEAAPLGDAVPVSVSSRDLPRGMQLRVVPHRELPLVGVRLLVRAGRASDGAKPGVAELTAELLAASGAGRFARQKLAERTESLGNTIRVGVDRDAVWLGLDVTRDHLDGALEILAAIATQPRFVPPTFERVKSRLAARAAADDRRATQALLSRRLFELPVGVHPYSHGPASTAELAALSLDDCRRWFRAHFVPGRSVLIVAGDARAGEVERAANAAFARWKGQAPAPPEPTAPMPPERVEIDVVDHPGSPLSDISVATLGPARDSPRWAALLDAVELLAGPSGRLARGLRDRRRLVRRIGAEVQEVRHGPVPVVLSARSSTAHTAEAVSGILSAMEHLAGALPDATEVDVATRGVVERSARKRETVQGLARLGARIAALGLPDSAYSDLDGALRDLDPRAVNAAAQLFLRKGHVHVVVSGDAKRIAPALAHFGPVRVVDPAHGFSVRRAFAADPTAPLRIAPAKAKEP